MINKLPKTKVEICRHALVNIPEFQFYQQVTQVFKKSQGYGKQEISQKCSALENVLILEAIDTHFQRLKPVSFSQLMMTLQCLNLTPFVAIK